MKLSPLNGQVFGYLTVLNREPKTVARKVRWTCQCVCGEQVVVIASNLVSGHTKSCGCKKPAMISSVLEKSLVGKVFSRLTVVSTFKTNGSSGRTTSICTCTCGNSTVVKNSNLISGSVKSCGCLRVDSTKERATTHGLSGSPEYISWFSMVQRCANPKVAHYKNYGGRGITVCHEWLSFDQFLKDMGKKPGAEYSLDRIDNNGNYCKENCRWATQVEQQNNKRTNHILCIDGVSKTIAEWSRYCSVSSNTINARVVSGKVGVNLIAPCRGES